MSTQAQRATRRTGVMIAASALLLMGLGTTAYACDFGDFGGGSEGLNILSGMLGMPMGECGSSCAEIHGSTETDDHCGRTCSQMPIAALNYPGHADAPHRKGRHPRHTKRCDQPHQATSSDIALNIDDPQEQKPQPQPPTQQPQPAEQTPAPKRTTQQPQPADQTPSPQPTTAPVTVVAKPTPQTPAAPMLPRTGSDVSMPLGLAGGFMSLGAGCVLASQRRRPTTMQAPQR